MITISIPGLFKIFQKSSYKINAFCVLSLICISFIYQYNLLYELVIL